MPAFLKLGTIKGTSTDTGHKDWIRIETMGSRISRSIVSGAKDQQRARGETTLGDIDLRKEADGSSVNVAVAAANGTFIKEAQIDFCSTINGKNEIFLTYKLSNVVITSHSINASGEGIPQESFSLNFTEIEWTYIVVDPKTGKPNGNIPGKYTLGEGSST